MPLGHLSSSSVKFFLKTQTGKQSKVVTSCPVPASNVFLKFKFFSKSYYIMTLCRRRCVSSLMSTSLVWQRGRVTEGHRAGAILAPQSIFDDGGQRHRDIQENKTNKKNNQEHHWTDVIKVYTLSSCDLVTWLQGSLRSTSHHLEVLEHKFEISTDVVTCAYQENKKKRDLEK